MATVTYDWQTRTDSFFVNEATSGDQRSADVAVMGRHGFFATWEPGTTEFTSGRAFDRSASPASEEFRVNTTTENEQYDPHVAGQARGVALVTFTDLSGDGIGDVRGRLIRADGTPLGDDFLISGSGFADYRGDVAALSDGGYVVSWTRDFSGDGDVRAQVVNANGTLRGGGALGVNSSSSLVTDYSAVAGLAGGGFVVGWQQADIADGNFDTVAFVRYDAGGQRLDADPVIIDNVGTIKDDLHVVGLADGGFAFAYEDDGFGNGLDISLRIYDADGTPRTVAKLANGTENDGDQRDPTITVLGNGFIVVGWRYADIFRYQAFDPDGGRVGEISGSAALVIEAEIAGQGGGQMRSEEHTSELQSPC